MGPKESVVMSILQYPTNVLEACPEKVRKFLTCIKSAGILLCVLTVLGQMLYWKV